MRKRKFNKGRWQIEKERLHLAGNTPPPEETDAEAVGDAIPALLARMGLSQNMWLRNMEQEWVELVGGELARHARPGRYDNGRLRVFVDSAAWLNELKRYGLKQMQARLQERFGADRITAVVLEPDPEGRGLPAT